MSRPFETARFEALKRLAAKNYGKTTRAENEVLRRSASTENDDPRESRERLEIRAEFLRWLATDKEGAANIDALGIRVANITIVTPLELDYCKLTFPLRFDYCTFLGPLSFVSAELPTLSFFHCETGAAVYAEGLKTTGSVFLRNLNAYGEIRLVGAQIGGFLNCGGATLNPRGDALVADGAKIGTYFFLRPEFCCHGIIRLAGAEIGRDLDCTGATLKATGDVLFADGAIIKGNVFLRGFSSSGGIRLVGTQIDGDLDCISSQVVELYCREMRVAGDLIWMNVRQPSQTNLRLSGATIGTLHDDQASWPHAGRLHILDFAYRDLALHEKSTDLMDKPQLAHSLRLRVEDRIEWLMLQPKGERVIAQPWIQVANLLEANGDADGAKQVVYEYRRQQMGYSNSALRLVTWPYDRLEEQPLWIGVPILTLGAVGSFMFWRARRISAMAPTDKDARTTLEKCGKLPAGYPPFNPIVYALENVLPVIKLGQDSAWTPDPQAPTDNWVPERPVWLRRLASRWRFTRYVSRLDYRRLAVLRWTLILLGWAFALILAAAIGSRFKP